MLEMEQEQGWHDMTLHSTVLHCIALQCTVLHCIAYGLCISEINTPAGQ